MVNSSSKVASQISIGNGAAIGGAVTIDCAASLRIVLHVVLHVVAGYVGKAVVGGGKRPGADGGGKGRGLAGGGNGGVAVAVGIMLLVGEPVGTIVGLAAT